MCNLEESFSRFDELWESPRKSMDDEAVMNLFEKFTGCIKAEVQVDCRKEKCEHLDEKFNS